jgi:4-nitrophenyl phosphatase
MDKSLKFPVLCDLDGVVWLAHQPIDGSADAVERLRTAGHRVVFVTNNSSATVADQEAALLKVGIPAVGDVITSAMAGAHLLSAGERVLMCGGPGLAEAIAKVGAISVSHDDVEGGAQVDTVIVGFHRHFDYEIMRRASTAIRRGARLVGTNDDATYPTPNGPIPGGGSILAAISTAAGIAPMIAGKPHQAMADVVRVYEPSVGPDAVMVGDRPSTDGGFATTLGCRFALVRSGVTPAEVMPADQPGWFEGTTLDIDVPNLAGLADCLLK